MVDTKTILSYRRSVGAERVVRGWGVIHISLLTMVAVTETANVLGREAGGSVPLTNVG